MTEATARALSAPLAQQRGQLGGVVEQLAGARLDRAQRLDHGVAGVLLQRAVLGVAVGDVVGLAVVERGEDLRAGC